MKDMIMHTLQFQIQDDIYQNIIDSGIDIQTKFKEFLTELVDDGYPSISTQEAKKRVSEAVEEYENGKGSYLLEEEYNQEMNIFMDNLATKYANH
jgi:polyhydroxyalkanoate synthesis regulator phasin